jgi:hypothetical protein
MVRLCTCAFTALMIVALLAGCAAPTSEPVTIQEMPVDISTAVSLEPSPSPTFTPYVPDEIDHELQDGIDAEPSTAVTNTPEAQQACSVDIAQELHNDLNSHLTIAILSEKDAFRSI